MCGGAVLGVEAVVAVLQQRVSGVFFSVLVLSSGFAGHDARWGGRWLYVRPGLRGEPITVRDLASIDCFESHVSKARQTRKQPNNLISSAANKHAQK